MPENDDKQFSKTEREGWDAENLVKESANKMPDETQREILRADATKGDADGRDVVGSTDTNETPQGREEAKPHN